jgi:SAM-dependent methyltransferase
VSEINPCPTKTDTDLALEWDRLAAERHRQIVSGEDLSFEYVLVPATFRLLEGLDTRLVLDVGSGTGDLTARLARVATSVVGIEPSRASVAIARKSCADLRNVRFVEARLEEVSAMLHGESATGAVASMTLMTTLNLGGFATALAALLRAGSRFVATLTHPCFWPRYWGYETEAWFNYEKETVIEAPFVISKFRTEIRTTHVHRPLEQYVTTFAKAGFMLETLAEPMPSAEVQALYPRPWQFPRFIALRWVKTA